MSYIKFDKTILINLSSSLNRELIRSNRAGSYASTTILSSNTRKYHGLLVCPVENLDGGHHVLLSGLHETVIQHNQSFNLGMHKYAGDYYNPKGHKYLRDFYSDPIPTLIYRVGDVVLSKEIMLSHSEERILIRYTVIEANSLTRLRLRPFMAYRNIHSLSKANMDVITKITRIKNGIRAKMYEGYPGLRMQFSKEPEFISGPDWYYNVEYMEEQKRGYDYKEDLYTPGFFEIPVRRGQKIVFSAGTISTDPKNLPRKFSAELKKRIPRNSFHNCLVNSGQQFIIKKEKKTELISGFPWISKSPRTTFGALPGIAIAAADLKTFKSVLASSLSGMNISMWSKGVNPFDKIFGGVDEPLWFIWALQQFAHYSDNREAVWKKFGVGIRAILNLYRRGADNYVEMHENGLLYCSNQDKPATWMNCRVEGIQVTPRHGYIVEINALWYNAVKFAMRLAELSGDSGFISRWQKYPELISKSFKEHFYDENRKYLADFVSNGEADWSVRPNQVIAASLPYSPVSAEVRKELLTIVTAELLTPKGLRTLSPKSNYYKGVYEGDETSRDSVAHQGTVYPWLLGHYSEAWLRLYKKSGVDHIKRIYIQFEDDLKVHGVGTISELYDGDPPHIPGGAVSYSWSIAEVLRMEQLIIYYQSL